MKIPGTDIEFGHWRARLYATSLSRGDWDLDPPTHHALLGAVGHLSDAGQHYIEERIVPPSFYRKGAVYTAVDGSVIGALALAVVYLAGLGERMGVASPLWEGFSRHHQRDFHADLFSIINRVVRLKESYPTEAISMIERMAAAWVSRAEFWKVVLRVAERREA
jgi:hypothetical protein